MMGNDYFLEPEDYEIAKSNGISYKQVYERFYNYGWTKRDAITRPLGRKSLWPQYKALCEQNGIKQPTFYTRIQLGMSPDEAATLPPSKKNRLFKTVKITQEMIQQAEANGIKPNTFLARVYNYRWEIDRAMTDPVEEKYARKTNTR